MSHSKGEPHPAIAGVIYGRARQLGLSVADVARRASLSRSCLYKLLEGVTLDPSIKTLYRLSAAIEVAPISLFRFFTSLESHHSASGSQAATRAVDNPADAIQFSQDTTIPDNALVTPGESFRKIWSVQNVGDVPWHDRMLERIDDEFVVARRQPNGQLQPVLDAYLMSATRSVALPHVVPGQSLDVAVDFVAPRENCSVASIWRFVDRHGVPVYPVRFFLQVIVTVVGF